MVYVYLDFNVILDIANGLKIQSGSDVVFVYSYEHFVETARGSDLRPIEVLKDLGAHKLDVELDENFQYTGRAHFTGDANPLELFRSWQETIGQWPEENPFSAVLSRLLGAQNHEELVDFPANVQRQLTSLLEEHGLLDEGRIESIDTMRQNLETFVAGGLKGVPALEEQRKGFGLHGGRAGNLAESENALEALWEVVGPTAPGLSADQFFGFEPIPGDPRPEIPFFLGITGCYTVLNSLGMRPDRGLSDPSALPGISSDASHVAHASYCDVLLSADERLCAKARALYRYKDIPTSVKLLQRVR